MQTPEHRALDRIVRRRADRLGYIIYRSRYGEYRVYRNKPGTRYGTGKPLLTTDLIETVASFVADAKHNGTYPKRQDYLAARAAIKYAYPV